jgi:hypothetical protein
VAYDPITYENLGFFADTAPNSQKQQVFQSLLRRFGSRRALIEELDRLKRLRLLKPGSGTTVDDGGRRLIGVQNVPNPEWREIDTPSLLISGEISSLRPNILLSAVPLTPEFHKVCKGCHCELDEISTGCLTCKMRHRARDRRKEQISQLTERSEQVHVKVPTKRRIS